MRLKVGILCFLLLTGFCGKDKPISGGCPKITLTDSTLESGMAKFNQTFSVAVVDINNDGSDDLVLSNHGFLPSLFLKKKGVFEDHSLLFPDQVISDRHGVTAVDLDNDGDKDIIFASVYTLGKEVYLSEEYFSKDYFDYIVVDEFHHADAKSYRRVLDYFEPKFLLGLTATPDEQIMVTSMNYVTTILHMSVILEGE